MLHDDLYFSRVSYVILYSWRERGVQAGTAISIFISAVYHLAGNCYEPCRRSWEMLQLLCQNTQSHLPICAGERGLAFVNRLQQVYASFRRAKSSLSGNRGVADSDKSDDAFTIVAKAGCRSCGQILHIWARHTPSMCFRIMIARHSKYMYLDVDQVRIAAVSQCLRSADMRADAGGCYTLRQGERLQEAMRLATGASESGDPDLL